MKIYIVGTGAVGGYFGGVLAKTGEDVTFVARGDNFRAIKKNGIEINSVKSGNFVIKPAKVVSEISEITNPDFIIFTVKTYDTESASRELAKVVTDKTSIITFQNGIENDKVIKKFIKKAGVYPGLAYIVSAKTRDGVVGQTSGLCKLIFGDRKTSKNTNLLNIEKLLQKSGIDALYSDDIERDMWKKYIFISSMSGLSALARITVGQVMTDHVIRKLYERCLKECLAVAVAEGVKLSKDILDSIIELSEKTDKNAKFSMLVDIEKGRRTEVETLNGTVVKLAKKHGIDVPINETIYGAIKLLN